MNDAPSNTVSLEKNKNETFSRGIRQLVLSGDLVQAAQCCGPITFPAIADLNKRRDPGSPSMTAPSVTPSQVRRALLLRSEIALLDLRHEAAFATGLRCLPPTWRRPDCAGGRSAVAAQGRARRAL